MDPAFKPVTKSKTCAVCGKPDWCRRSDDGAHECHRSSTDVPGFKLLIITRAGYGLYRAVADDVRRGGDSSRNLIATRLNPKLRANASTPVQSSNGRTWSSPNPLIANIASDIGGKLEAIYDYNEQFKVARFALADGDKQFRPLHCDARGWHAKDPPGPLPLYKAAETAGADRIYVCEGEKATDAARLIGLVAVTSAHGAKSAGKSDWSPLANRDVAILPDNDKPGRQYAQTVAAILHKLKCRVRIVELPDLAETEDIADLIDKLDSRESDDIRRGIEELVEATPFWNPHGIVVVDANTITPTPVQWLWPGRIPHERLSLLFGDADQGKSFMSCDISARVTTGREFPDGASSRKGTVVMVTAEDNFADTIVPRLKANGADLHRVKLIKGRIREDSDTPDLIDFDTDLQALEGAIAEIKPVMVVVDPISAFLGKTDGNSNVAVRVLLTRLAQVAERQAAAIIAIHHTNKSGGTRSSDKMLGSRAFDAAPRAVWFVSRDPNDDDRILFLKSKLNIAKNTTGLAFRVQDDLSLAWESEGVRTTANDVLKEQSEAADPTQRDDAIAFLQDELEQGKQPTKQLMQRARDAGIAEKTLRRAKTSIGAEAIKEGFGNETVWYWTLRR